ncbi:MAG: ABC transporter permease [Caulobacterales bacterium]|nr:ABC transporter permease [Caulobacterales bacterium]
MKEARSISGLRILAIMAKEFTQLTRDRLTYAMILAVPIMQLLLFGYAINNDPRHLPAVLLDQDRSVMSRSAAEAIRNTGYFAFVKEVNSPREIDEAIESGKAQFAVTIPGDFERRVVRGDGAQILVEADASDPTTVGGAVAALAGLPQTALQGDLKGALATRQPAPGGAQAAGAAPFEMVIHRRYNPENITAYNIVPGLLGIVLSMTLVMMTSLALTRERERGTMETLLATPVEPLEVMLGKLAPYVGIGLVQTAIILTLARLLFGVPFMGGWGALSIGVALFIVGSLSLGFFFSTLARSQLQAMQMSVFYLLPSLLLSGFMFPFRGMPAWAQAIGQVIPVTHFLRIVRGALLKGVGLSETWPSVLALAAFVLVVGALSVARYRTTLD